MSHKIYLKVNTDLAASAEVLSWFEQLNQPAITDQKVWWQCQTLLQEGFANIVEHAHKNLPATTPVEIEAERLDDLIDIRIWSYGKQFDLVEKLQNTTELVDNDKERGRGLKIMSAIADQLSYEHTADRRYCLFMRKFLTA